MSVLPICLNLDRPFFRELHGGSTQPVPLGESRSALGQQLFRFWSDELQRSHGGSDE
jgi:hypothetical protein